MRRATLVHALIRVSVLQASIQLVMIMSIINPTTHTNASIIIILSLGRNLG